MPFLRAIGLMPGLTKNVSSNIACERGETQVSAIGFAAINRPKALSGYRSDISNAAVIRNRTAISPRTFCDGVGHTHLCIPKRSQPLAASPPFPSLRAERAAQRLADDSVEVDERPACKARLPLLG